jgi:GR25 family glycosyltransferase involved in LPS biosynthesis
VEENIGKFSIFVLNLPHRVDRWNKTSKELGKSSLLRMFSISRYPATIGLSLQMRKLYEENKILSSGYLSAITPKIIHGTDLSPGAVGCALSHRELWNKSSIENRTLLVFEDDIKLAHNFLMIHFLKFCLMSFLMILICSISRIW